MCANAAGQRVAMLNAAERLLAGATVAQHVVQNLSEAAVARMVATVAWAPLVGMASPRHADQSCAMPCAGEASTEAEYQARREAVIVSYRTVCHQA